jgi:hypothetical protein
MYYNIDTIQNDSTRCSVSKTIYEKENGNLETVYQISGLSTSSYDYSIAPPKPLTVTDGNWWRLKADYGMNQALYPRSFADAHFRLRKVERKPSMITNGFTDSVFNRVSFNRNLADI